MEPYSSVPLASLEELRLQALRPYQLYNTMQDETFTELVRLAAKLFEVPIAIIAFVEEEEVRFGLNHGLDPSLDRVNRWETLCSVALLHESVSVFEDLKANPCDLINNVLVRRLDLGFYAGCTLRTAAGYPIGVLCVIDHQARSFSDMQSDLLERLAAVVMRLLDLRLRLLLQPTWNQRLWAAIYARIESSVTRLETLAALARWEAEPDSEYARANQQAAQEEIKRVVDVLLEQIQAVPEG
ncbi:GAF domain-containing protein [Hymenobacter sp. RP-2-7]|uniref:GAF domain-containing protein n=1 Tax=Hymenobacter polaris TaxID=2682546 RepID=A0A7Y0AF44_9BACT|nr:GAF domain-containing protein [Hymenobacter polaris]NML66203.1 GAF domain-containing protein [Hymenobacter polaris]